MIVIVNILISFFKVKVYFRMIFINLDILMNGRSTYTVSRMFNFIAQKLFKKPRISQIHLDEMGNFIWPLMDGERNLIEIAEVVKAEFGEKAEPLYNRLVQYVRTLETYGFITVEPKH